MVCVPKATAIKCRHPRKVITNPLIITFIPFHKFFACLRSLVIPTSKPICGRRIRTKQITTARRLRSRGVAPGKWALRKAILSLHSWANLPVIESPWLQCRSHINRSSVRCLYSLWSSIIFRVAPSYMFHPTAYQRLSLDRPSLERT